MATSSKALTQPCYQCQHYYITHEVSFPYGCRALDFKSRRMPVLDVLDASGQQCLYWKPKSDRLL